MKNEKLILEAYGIETVTDELTINSEIEARQMTARKINAGLRGYGDFENYKPEVLHGLYTENEAALKKLFDLKKNLSPYKNIVPKQSDKYEVGAIVVSSWGFDQTNIDFLCVVKVSGQFVTMMPMTQLTSPEIGFMTNYELPGEIDLLADPIRRKVNSSNYVNCGESYTYGKLWDGKKQTSTHYA